MATVNIMVYEHHKKTDGTYNVKIRVYHRKVKKLIDTTFFVTQKQLDSKLEVKDKFVLKSLEATLDNYRKWISELGDKLNFFSAEELRNYLRDKKQDVDFIKFCAQHIEQLKSDGRTATANNHRTVRNNLIDYFGREQVSINEISSNMLFSFEKFLKRPRIMYRVDQFGKLVEIAGEGASDSSIHNYMRDLRTLFNAACTAYNNEDLGIYKIKHYPFKKYKIGSAPLTKKRNIGIDELKQIRDCIVEPDSRAELARDLFMLSFYLCGMNAVDLYQLDKNIVKDNRLEYNRSKTRLIRRDNAFISIKIVAEAKALLDKYAGTLKSRYNTIQNLNRAICKGMLQIREITGINFVTFYWARHTFANLARNKCRMSKDDVALALNHIDEGHRTTDIYIEKDWSIIDEVQEKVVALLEPEREKEVVVIDRSLIMRVV
ncbi:site-specific integrase [Arcticibacter sp.]|uniref:site-specific integrase n=1 Tax=Arcticibacter sp. TaxID=1872630 RepID=UPI00388F5F38